MTNEYYRQGSLEPATSLDRTETCPVCGAMIFPGCRFCSECGRPLLPQNRIREILQEARTKSREFFDQKDYQKALQCFLDVLPLTYAENDALMLNMTGIRYRQAGNNEKALEYYLKAHACVQTDAVYLQNIASQYDVRGDFENADYYYRRAVDTLKDHPDKDNEGTIYLNYARCLGKNGEFSKARELLALAEQNGKSKEECSEAWASFR